MNSMRQLESRSSRKKKGWATKDSDKQIVLSTLRRKGSNAVERQQQQQQQQLQLQRKPPKVVSRFNTKMAASPGAKPEGINTLVGRLDKIRQDLASPKFALKRDMSPGLLRQKREKKKNSNSSSSSSSSNVEAFAINDDSVKGSDGSRKDFVRRAKERRGEIKAEAAGAVEAPAERNGKLTNPFEKIIAL